MAVKYWTFRHKPGDEATLEDCSGWVEDAIKGNFAFMQYEYRDKDKEDKKDNFQPRKIVTQQWNAVKKLNEGDCLFLRGDKRIHAVGKIIKPRIAPTIPLQNIEKILEAGEHGENNKYRSDNFNGCIHFDDSSVFYELLDANQDAGQRVDVDAWIFYTEEGIGKDENSKPYDFDHIDDYVQEDYYLVVRELKPNAGKRILEKLKGKFMSKELKLLEANKNLILTGAPGTGKTHLAEKLACKFIFNKEKEHLSDDEKKEFNKRHKFVQFHPSYDYTDFVEGLRPTQPDKDGNIKFELKDGIFKKFCKEAAKEEDAVPERRYVFVIDEINRGEISKIFGELFFSIDPDYRGDKGIVQTQYHNMINKDNKVDPFCEGFYVPKNVYIIGTMNDIDRSVESFDFAMRRRFVWCEITAEESAKSMNLSEETKNRMVSLNKVIEKTEGLGRSYQIGGAYFLERDEKGNVIRDENNVAVPSDYGKLWKTRLKPLLSEYLRGFEQKEADDILKEFRKAYDNAQPQDES